MNVSGPFRFTTVNIHKYLALIRISGHIQPSCFETVKKVAMTGQVHVCVCACVRAYVCVCVSVRMYTCLFLCV